MPTHSRPSTQLAGWSEQRLTLVLVCVVQLTFTTTMTIVTVSLPSVQRQFQISAADIQWVITGYGATFGGLLLVGGRLADLYGRRRTLLAGTCVFAVGGVACIVAPTGEALIGGRALQGLGASIAAPAALSLLTHAFSEPHERGRALSLWATVGAAGAIIGNVAGGLTAALPSWRWSFVPILVLALVIVAACLRVPSTADARVPGKVGLLPGAMMTTVIATAILASTQASNHGLGSRQCLIPAGLSCVALIGFVSAQRWGRTILLPIEILRSRTAAGFGLVALTSSLVMSIYFFSSFLLQDVRGLSPLQTGLSFGLWSFAIIVGARLAPPLMRRAGPRRAVAITYAVALVGVGLFAHSLRADDWWAVWTLAAFVLLGTGLGAAGVPSTFVALSSVGSSHHGIGAGVLSTCQTAGGMIGLAVLNAIAAERTHALGGGGAEAQLSGIEFAVLCALGIALVIVPSVLLVLPRRSLDDYAASPVDEALDDVLSAPAGVPGAAPAVSCGSR